jgi:hypothetical protein
MYFARNGVVISGYYAAYGFTAEGSAKRLRSTPYLRATSYNFAIPLEKYDAPAKKCLHAQHCPTLIAKIPRPGGKFSAGPLSMPKD